MVAGVLMLVFVFIFFGGFIALLVFIASNQFKYEEQAMETKKKITLKIKQAKKLLESGQYKQAHDILKKSLAKISFWRNGENTCIHEFHQEQFDEINMLLHEIEQEERLLHRIENNLGSGIKDLAVLRSKGMISDHEFEAFSERFKVSTGEKAQDIIKAISDLHVQYQNSAMSEGNYHAGLWSLLDKLDRKT